jgi:hypothetical protein
MEEDIRWQQRFSNYTKAFDKLEEAVQYITNSKNENSNALEIIQEGLIQRAGKILYSGKLP